MDDGGGDALIEAFREQVRCDKLGSPFTARLLEWLVDDWLAGGPLRTLLPTERWPPGQDLNAWRLSRRAMRWRSPGRHPELAAAYRRRLRLRCATATGDACANCSSTKPDYIARHPASALQTNE